MRRLIFAVALRPLLIALMNKSSSELVLLARNSVTTVSVKVIVYYSYYRLYIFSVMFTIICIGVNTFLCGVTGIVAAMAIVLHLGWSVPGNQKFYTCSNEGGCQGLARLLAGLDSLYEYWHYGMGTAAGYNLPLKKLNSKWSRAELKSRS